MDAVSISLKEYIERVLDEREKATKATLEAALRSSETAAKEMERRLEALNELRAEVVRDRGRFLERQESDATHAAIEKRFNALERWNAQMVGIGLAVVVFVGVLSSLISVILSW